MRGMEVAILYLVTASAIVSLFIYSLLRTRAEWRGLPLKLKAAGIMLMPIAVAVMLLLMIPVMFLAAVVSIIGAMFALARFVLSGKRPPPKAFPDPGREAGASSAENLGELDVQHRHQFGESPTADSTDSSLVYLQCERLRLQRLIAVM